MKTKLLLIFIFIGLISMDTFSRSFRVDQVPNGNRFSCQTCHTGSGGPRNDFGALIENSYLDGSGNVIWGNALAILDADGDGASNGLELQDAEGTWSIGDPNPGVMSEVTNPGDPNSVSDTGIKTNTIAAPVNTTLYQNYPNPFNVSTTIHFYALTSGQAQLSIFSIDGKKIWETERMVSGQGYQKIHWHGEDLTGNPATSGIYIYALKTGNQIFQKKMMLLK